MSLVFISDFNHESVLVTQQQVSVHAPRDFDVNLARNARTQHAVSARSSAARVARYSANNRLITSPRAVPLTGLIALQTGPDARNPSPLAPEYGDRQDNPRTMTGYVVGSVFNGVRCLISAGRRLGGCVKLTGVPAQVADPTSASVARAEGTVVKAWARQECTFRRSSDISDLKAEPSASVFVPESADETTVVHAAWDWTQVFSRSNAFAAVTR